MKCGDGGGVSAGGGGDGGGRQRVTHTSHIDRQRHAQTDTHRETHTLFRSRTHTCMPRRHTCHKVLSYTTPHHTQPVTYHGPSCHNCTILTLSHLPCIFTMWTVPTMAMVAIRIYPSLYSHRDRHLSLAHSTTIVVQ